MSSSGFPPDLRIVAGATVGRPLPDPEWSKVTSRATQRRRTLDELVRWNRWSGGVTSRAAAGRPRRGHAPRSAGGGRAHRQSRRPQRPDRRGRARGPSRRHRDHPHRGLEAHGGHGDPGAAARPVAAHKRARRPLLPHLVGLLRAGDGVVDRNHAHVAAAGRPEPQRPRARRSRARNADLQDLRSADEGLGRPPPAGQLGEHREVDRGEAGRSRGHDHRRAGHGESRLGHDLRRHGDQLRTNTITPGIKLLLGLLGSLYSGTFTASQGTYDYSIRSWSGLTLAGGEIATVTSPGRFPPTSAARSPRRRQCRCTPSSTTRWSRNDVATDKTTIVTP